MRPVSGLKILDLSEFFGPNFDIKGYKTIFFLVLFFDWPHRDGKSTMKPLCLMDISLVLYQDNTEFIQIYFPYNRKPYIYIYKSSPRGYSFYLLALQATSKSSLAQIVTCSHWYFWCIFRHHHAASTIYTLCGFAVNSSPLAPISS